MKYLYVKYVKVIPITILLAVFIILPEYGFAEQRMTITSSIANMRSGPGPKYDVLWQVERYHPVKILKKKGGWYKIIDFENDMAWVDTALLGNIEGVISIKTNCNVRSQASIKSAILFTVDKGVPFKVIEKKENWLKIKHKDGDVGWIHKSLVW